MFLIQKNQIQIAIKKYSLILAQLYFQAKYLSKMQEGFQIKVQNIVCPNLKPAKMICASKKCKENAFICNQESCQSCEQKHLQCQCFKINRILKVLSSKKQKTSNIVEKALKAMQKTYDEVIERISKDKQYVLGLAQTFGYFQKETEFLRLINEGNVSEVTGEMTSKVLQTLNLKLSFQIDEEGVRKFWRKRKIEFQELFDKFKSLTNKKVLRLESMITDQVDLIEQFLVQPVIQFNLLFRASEHNYSSAKFHQFCDNRINTLVIAKTQFGRIIGGFTNLPWNTSSSYTYDQDGKTFLFSFSEHEKFPLKLKQYGIYNYVTYGPTFGGGHDFCITDNCKSAQDSSYFNFGHSFNSADSKHVNGQGAYTMFCGSPVNYYAKVDDYQVFQVQFM